MTKEKREAYVTTKLTERAIKEARIAAAYMEKTLVEYISEAVLVAAQRDINAHSRKRMKDTSSDR